MQVRKLESRSLFANAADSTTLRTNARRGSLAAPRDELATLVLTAPILSPLQTYQVDHTPYEQRINPIHPPFMYLFSAKNADTSS
jgi:hypothetical protein